MVRRVWSVAGLAALVTGVVGCGSKPKEDGQTSADRPNAVQAEPQQPSGTVAVTRPATSAPGGDNPVVDQPDADVVQFIEKMAALHGYGRWERMTVNGEQAAKKFGPPGYRPDLVATDEYTFALMAAKELRYAAVEATVGPPDRVIADDGQMGNQGWEYDRGLTVIRFMVGNVTGLRDGRKGDPAPRAGDTIILLPPGVLVEGVLEPGSVPSRSAGQSQPQPKLPPELAEAVEQVRRLKGNVKLRKSEAGEWAVYRIEFRNAFITGDNLDVLTKLPTVRELVLYGCTKLTDIIYVGKLPELRLFDLTATDGLTADASAVIAGLGKLEELHLPRSTSNEGLAAVRGLTNLRWLDLRSSVKITDEGMEALSSLQQLRHLSLPQRVGGLGLKAVGQLAGLEEIDQPGRAGGATPVGAEDIRHLTRLPKLATLKLPHVPFTVAMLDELQAAKSLKLLQVGTPRTTRRKGENTGENTDAAIIRLKQAIPGLEIKR